LLRIYAPIDEGWGLFFGSSNRVRFIDIHYRRSGKSGIGGKHYSELKMEIEDSGDDFKYT
jgi:hypothetical protein